MKQIATNLYSSTRRGIFCVPIFILEKSNGKITLIDTGLKKDAKKISKEIIAKWGSLENIERIIFTHRHYDHVGGLSTFIKKLKLIPNVDLSNIEIVMHELEAPLFQSEYHKMPIEINRFVKHDEVIDIELDIKVIHNPGHTFGHICLLLQKEKIILTGDSFMCIFGSLRPVFRKAHDDYNQYLQTIPQLLNYDWDFAIPSHMSAKMIPRKEIEEFIAKLSR
ncbi:MAG: MBL fold metallo-hydrolase [Candidatus Heimdallarchaeota archaeon]|nr:MBL fold metallo-hydrolase [Candidatus Heimdallarchaeota archaeon]